MKATARFIGSSMLLTLPAYGAIILHSESSSFDLSDDYLTPTTLVLPAGVSFLEVSVNEFDRDLFSLNIPVGVQLDAILLRNYGSASAANQSFIGFQENRLNLSTFPSSGFPDPINYALVSSATLNVDLLPTMVATAGASNPLQSGNHAFWINESGIASTMTFEFQSSLVSSSVPEPSSVLFVTIASALYLTRRARVAKKSHQLF